MLNAPRKSQATISRTNGQPNQVAQARRSLIPAFEVIAAARDAYLAAQAAAWAESMQFASVTPPQSPRGN